MKKWLIALLGLAALICGTVTVTHYLTNTATVQAGGSGGGGTDKC